MFFKYRKINRFFIRSVVCVFFLLLILGNLFSRSIPYSFQEVIDRIAAVVNNDVVTLSDVKIAISFGFFEEELGLQKTDIQPILERIINQKLVLGLMQDRASVEPQAVESEYQSLLSKLGNEIVLAKLEEYGLQQEDLLTYIHEYLLYQRIIEDRFGMAVSVSLEEIEKYYHTQFVPAKEAELVEPPSLMDALEEVESAIKKVKIRALVADWLDNLRREADIQILLKEAN